jgi:hypothetical protein
VPPHCDAIDGPVVQAAKAALERGDVNLVLAYVPATAETEVREAYELASRVRGLSRDAQAVADLHLFETAVRVHRAAEGASYTGLKPAGLDHGPVIPVAERALASGSADELADFLTRTLHDELRSRFAHATALKSHAEASLEDARAYTQALLGLQVWAHALYTAVKAPAHAHAAETGHTGAHQQHAA